MGEGGTHPSWAAVPRSSRFAQCSITLPSATLNQCVWVVPKVCSSPERPVPGAIGSIPDECPDLPAGHRGVHDDQVAVGHHVVDLPVQIGVRVAQPQCRGIEGRGPVPRQAGGSASASRLRASGGDGLEVAEVAVGHEVDRAGAQSLQLVWLRLAVVTGAELGSSWSPDGFGGGYSSGRRRSTAIRWNHMQLV